MPALHELRFRSSSFVELRRLHKFSGEERDRFRDLESDLDFYGLFVPRSPFRTNLKSVPRQTAELFRTLAEPALLDGALLRDERSWSEVIDLVLDGILEVDSGAGFVCGADALPLVCPPCRGAVSAGAAARPSIEALRYAQDLVTEEPHVLTTALYQYNRMPITSAWRARFPDRDAFLAEIGADQSSVPGWMVWSSGRRRRFDRGAFKLYVSPRPERLRDTFKLVVRVLGILPDALFKIGNCAAGLLRPDKLVAYFTSRAGLDRAADALRHELAGCDAHGVPFTGCLDDSGLLSWGIDPPASDRPL